MKIFEKIENLKLIYNKIQKKAYDEKQNSINGVDKKGIVKRTIFTMLNPNYWLILGGSIFASAIACFIPSIVLKVLNTLTLLNSSVVEDVIHSKGMFIITFIVVLTFFLKTIFKSEKNDIIENDSQYYNVDQDSIKLLMQYMYQLNELNKEMKYLMDCYENEEDELKNSYELYSSFEKNLKEMLNDNNGKLMISDFNDLKDTIDEYQEELDNYGAYIKSDEIVNTLREKIIAETKKMNVELNKEVINEH